MESREKSNNYLADLVKTHRNKCKPTDGRGQQEAKLIQVATSGTQELEGPETPERECEGAPKNRKLGWKTIKKKKQLDNSLPPDSHSPFLYIRVTASSPCTSDGN